MVHGVIHSRLSEKKSKMTDKYIIYMRILKEEICKRITLYIIVLLSTILITIIYNYSEV